MPAGSMHNSCFDSISWVLCIIQADKRAEVALKEAATLKQNLSAAESRVKQVNELLEVNSTKENVNSASMGMQRLVFFVCGSAVAAAAAHFVGTSSNN